MLPIVSIVALIVLALDPFDVAGLSGGKKELIGGVGIFISVFTTIIILHWSRTLLLVRGFDIDKDLVVTKRKGTFSKISATATKDISKSSVFDEGKSSVRTSQKEPLYGNSTINPFEAAKTKNLLNRRQTCRDQLTHWGNVLKNTEAMMLMQAEVSSHESNVIPVPSKYGTPILQSEFYSREASVAEVESMKYTIQL